VNKRIDEKVNTVKNEMQEKIDALSIENEDLKRKLEKVEKTSTIRKDLNYTFWLTKQSVISANYNEQHSRKNNTKVFNFPSKKNENLRT
jgi:Skp family chaperone for outer membrane proteins